MNGSQKANKGKTSLGFSPQQNESKSGQSFSVNSFHRRTLPFHTMHSFRDPLSRTTAQILTRRLYRHPLPLQTRNGSVLSIFSSTMSYEYPNDRSAIFFDHRALPTIHRKMTLSNRRTQCAHPSYIITYPEPISNQNRGKHIDARYASTIETR